MVIVSLLLLVLVSSCSANGAPFEATLLRADGTNLNEESVPQYALASSTPTLHWSIRASIRGLAPKSYVLTLHDLSADPLKTQPSFVSHVIHSSSTTHLWSSHQDFPVLTSGTLYEWHVSGTLSNNDTYSTRAQPGRFRISLLQDQAWHNVSWLGSNDFNVYQTQFHVGATKPLDAILYIAGLGYSNVMLNGKPIGKNHLVTAPWTANERLVGFSALDVTANLLSNQVNSLTVMLGNGWREQSDFPYRDHDELGDDSVQKVLRAQLYFGSASSTKPITYTGDGTWTAAVGPSTYDSVYNGETFNATRMSYLMTATLNDTSTWQSAPQTKGPRGKMIPWSAPQVEITQEIPPISVHSPAPHVFVFDFGVNLAGVVRLNKLVHCKENERIILQHGK
jgi:hypothetical protein